jgi:hypothetical protein
LGPPASPVMPRMLPAGCWDHWLAVRSIWEEEGRVMVRSAWGAEPGLKTPDRAGWLGVWQRLLLAWPLKPCRTVQDGEMQHDTGQQ